MKKETLKGHLDLLLLAVVSSGAAHGYLLIRRLAEASDGALELPEGTLYPALHRLESKELLESSWTSVGGRRRRIYSLTRAGEQALARERLAWGHFSPSRRCGVGRGMNPNDLKSKRLRAFRVSLRKELVALFHADSNDPGLGRILDEAELHLEEAIAELIDSGATIEAATQDALARFGTPASVARAYGSLQPPSFVESQADAPRWRRLLSRWAPSEWSMNVSHWFSDIRLAMRFLAKSPGYALAFVLTLGLGIGANTAIFSVVHGIWLQPLPYRDGDRLVYLRHSAELVGIDNVLFSVAETQDYREQSETLEAITEFSAMTFAMLGFEEPKLVRAGIVTGNFFEVMGLGARRGRVIASSDDGDGVAAVAVLTNEYWQREFGADPDIVGRSVTMNGRSVEIIGVAEPAPPYPERTDLYVNLVASPHHLGASMVDDRQHRMTEVFARLAPGATLESAGVEIEGVTKRLHVEHPEAYDAQHGYTVRVSELRQQLAAKARPTMLMLLGVAAFVLLIACANVANLTLTKVMRRHDEWALRVSLGAKAGTLRRQLLLENLIPSLGGAVLGILIAVGGVDLLAAYIARYSARASEIAVDTTVLGVALVVAVLSACVFAFLPRLPGTRTPGTRQAWGWSSGVRASAGVATRRMQRLLVVVQVGVSFVLLFGAGLLLETLKNLQRDEGGVSLEETLTMRVPTDYGARDGQQLRDYYGTMVQKVGALPGVRSAALGSMIPLKESPTDNFSYFASLEFEIENQPTPPSAPPPRADFRVVSGEYFQTLGMTLLQGRTFRSSDDRSAPKVVIVNQALAERYFPGRNPVGQRLGWRGDMVKRYIGHDYRTIVGVVSDAKDYGVAAEVPHVVFNPFHQVTLADALFVRTAEPDAVIRPVIQQIRELDPQQPVVDIATLAQIRADSISPQRLNATLVGAFAFLALAVAAVGVAAVLAFGVSQRTREFGIRAAFGADRGLLMGVVLKEGAQLALLGLAIGLAASLMFSELISGLLHEVAATDLQTLGLVALILVAVALIASAIPAWRASEVDPVEALREG